MSTSYSARSGGTGFLSLLALLFIGLKLGAIIGWPWAVVTAPLWVPFAIATTVVLIAVRIRKLDALSAWISRN